MANRRQGVRKIDKLFIDKFGVTIDISLDTGSSTFEADFQGATFSDKDITALKKKLTDQVEAGAKDIHWVPVIEAEVEGWSGEDYIRLKYQRYWVANVNGKWMTCNQWDHDNEKKEPNWKYRFAHILQHGHRGFVHPLEENLPKTSGTDYFMLHTEEKWTALKQLENGIKKLKQGIRDLLSTPAGNARLEKSVQLLLK